MINATAAIYGNLHANVRADRNSLGATTGSGRSTVTYEDFASELNVIPY